MGHGGKDTTTHVVQVWKGCKGSMFKNTLLSGDYLSAHTHAHTHTQNLPSLPPWREKYTASPEDILVHWVLRYLRGPSARRQKITATTTTAEATRTLCELLMWEILHTRCAFLPPPERFSTASWSALFKMLEDHLICSALSVCLSVPISSLSVKQQLTGQLTSSWGITMNWQGILEKRGTPGHGRYLRWMPGWKWPLLVLALFSGTVNGLSWREGGGDWRERERESLYFSYLPISLPILHWLSYFSPPPHYLSSLSLSHS